MEGEDDTVVQETDLNDTVEAEIEGDLQDTALSQRSQPDIFALINSCASEICMENMAEAAHKISEALRLSSSLATPSHRLVHNFAQALEAIIHGVNNGTLLTVEDKLHISKVLESYCSMCPVVKFSRIATNNAILREVEDIAHIHIIDIDVMDGFQWDGFLYGIGRSGKLIQSVRITGLGCSEESLQSTGRRLHDIAAQMDLSFEFHPLVGKVSNFTVEDFGLKKWADEFVVVHMNHHYLYDISGTNVSVATLVKSLKPDFITLVEKNLGGEHPSFANKFARTLTYYSFLFEGLKNLDAEDDKERNLVERHLFGREIQSILVSNNVEMMREGGRLDVWKKELREAGFIPVSLDGDPFEMAGFLLSFDKSPPSWAELYDVFEHHGLLKLSLKGKGVLVIASAWKPPSLE